MHRLKFPTVSAWDIAYAIDMAGGKQSATRVGRQILLGLAGRLSMPRETSNAE
jgi:hypothetical protein